MTNPFPQQFQSFLTEYIHHLDLSALSPQYRKTATEITKLYNTLKPSLSENAQKTVTKLDDTHATQLTIATEIAYQKGFADGIKLILYVFEKG